MRQVAREGAKLFETLVVVLTLGAPSLRQLLLLVRAGVQPEERQLHGVRALALAVVLSVLFPAVCSHCPARKTLGTK